MNFDELIKIVSSISTWRNNDKKAPHKPFLLLLVLSKLAKGSKNSFPYVEIKSELRNLLFVFGSSNSHAHPEYPFLYLATNKIWIHNQIVKLSKVKAAELNVLVGRLRDDVYKLLLDDQLRIKILVEIILQTYFPPSQYDDILNYLEFEFNIVAKNRDPKFRGIVLQAYEYKCSVCRMKIQVGGEFVGLEAAHIKWHSAGGPDSVENGLSLCALHHKLFDKGAFTLLNRKLVVSESAHGEEGMQKWLLDFHGLDILKPINPAYVPNKLFIEWHNDQIFKKPARYLQ